MKKYLLSIVVTLIIASPLAIAQEPLKLRIVRGAEDTVYIKKHFIVGSTKQGSTISINGKRVKQYSTGSFGTEIELKEGSNIIEIKATNRSAKVSETLSVFYQSERPTTESVKIRELNYPSPVVVTDKGAYLNSSTAGDRLGGNKINFISEGVKMQLVAIEGDFYRVRLSTNREAYLLKRFAQLLPFGESPANSVLNSCTALAVGKKDRVKLFLNDRVPYVIQTQTNPSRIVVELHNTFHNSNWITQLNNLKEIESLHIYQSATDVVTVQIDLKERYSWGYRVEYEGNNLSISVNHTPKALYSSPKQSLEGLTIGVDAGHGGDATGAISPSAMLEKDLNLDMAKVLKEALEKRGAKVVLSRSNDTDIAISERIDKFIAADVDMVLSIHCNSGSNPLNPAGSSTYYKHIEYRTLALTVLNKILELGVNQYGLIGNFNFGLCSPSDFPSILVETLFMSSLPDEEKLYDQNFRKNMMDKVAEGVEEYIKKVRGSIVK